MTDIEKVFASKAALRGWQYRREYIPSHEDDDGELIDGFWVNTISKTEIVAGQVVFYCMDVSGATLGRPGVWSILFDLGDQGLEREIAKVEALA